MLFGGIWIVIPIYWSKQPDFFKRLFFTVVPFVAGMSIVGLLYEARIYSELVPVISALSVYCLHSFVNRHASSS